MTNKTEMVSVPREKFEAWFLATEHPILGWLDVYWLSRGDDVEGYASEYVQGLWVAFKAFSAPAEDVRAVGEEPAPFNDPLYNAESDARNAAAMLEEVLEWFDDGVGRSPEEHKLLMKIRRWLNK